MKYDKFWQFTRSPEYLNLLEQEKIGKAPTFGKQSSETLSTVSQVIRASAEEKRITYHSNQPCFIPIFCD